MWDERPHWAARARALTRFACTDQQIPIHFELEQHNMHGLLLCLSVPVPVHYETNDLGQMATNAFPQMRAWLSGCRFAEFQILQFVLRCDARMTVEQGMTGSCNLVQITIGNLVDQQGAARNGKNGRVSFCVTRNRYNRTISWNLEGILPTRRLQVIFASLQHSGAAASHPASHPTLAAITYYPIALRVACAFFLYLFVARRYLR